MAKCVCCGKLILGEKPEFCTKCGAPMPGSAASRSLEGGIQVMKRNNFSEATNVWRAFVKSNGQPSDKEYMEMLQAIRDCVVNHLPDSEFYNRNGLVDLALVLTERDLMEDVMGMYVNAIPEAVTKRQLHRLFSEYVYVVFESFKVYPDLSEMVKLLNEAQGVFTRFRDRLSTLPGEAKRAEEEMEFFVEYMPFLANKIKLRLNKEGRDRNSKAVKFWMEQPLLSYIEQLMDASMNYSRVWTAKRPSEKKEEDAEKKLDKFLDIYFGEPFVEKKKKRSDGGHTSG